VRFEAAWSLGQIGDERALPVLEWMQNNDEGISRDWKTIKWAASESIKRIKQRQEMSTE
jgi:HEAT repeat protein